MDKGFFIKFNIVNLCIEMIVLLDIFELFFFLYRYIKYFLNYLDLVGVKDL